jgi:transposase
MKNRVPLILSELVTLQEAQKNAKDAHFRNRCLAIELRLSRDKSVFYISDLLQVRENTIYEWLSRWATMGIVGLMILPGRGVKAAIDVVLDEPSQESITLIKKKLKIIPKS